ncbi:hypothetical protein F3Y22_tig00112673pilonHSYRG00140 [Hibiscus syriacus]|uniref:Reverse transcriptase Ty1/copia-type domain-containing protein n=1 Tax=Hibiscus syriacus TaxID=106335 RepID=A0A6A2WV60_HIBSY|nr:hypothetical protein F3Y22_tig00112673pilonHSYRG00140 [Hibiscus syriacus]
MDSINFTHPLYLHPSDTSGTVLVSYQSTRIENYNLWSRSILIALLWDRCNAIVLSWILNTVSVNLSVRLVFASTTAHVWKDLKDHFSKIDGSQIFFLHREIALFTQDDSSVSAYYSHLKLLWDEYNALVHVSSCNCVDSSQALNLILQQRLFQFLMELNETYSSIQSHILLLDPLPSENRAYSMVVQEESQRCFSSGVSSLSDTVAMYSNSTNSHRGRFNGVCDFCKICGHKRDQCYRLNGFPPDFKFTKTNKTSSAMVANSDQADNHSESSPLTFSLAPVFTSDQYNRLLKLLNKDVHESGDVASANFAVIMLNASHVLFIFRMFYPDFCIFKDLSNGKILGIGRKQGGLLPSAVLNWKSLYEMFHLKPPSLLHLKVFGCLGYATQTKPRDKFVPRAIPSVFMGYSDTQKDVSSTHESPALVSSPSVPVPVDHVVRRSSRVSKPPLWLNECVSCQSSTSSFHSISHNISYSHLPSHTQSFLSFTSIVEPTNYNDAIKDPLWVYKVKFRSNGKVEQYKVRLVTKGYNQREGVDFVETFSPVAKLVTVQTFLVLASLQHWSLFQMDVYNAFLQGTLLEEVYMQLPHGFCSQGENMVCRLHKSIYGLKQASRQWNMRLTEALVAIGYVQKELKVILYASFRMKDLGELKYFIGFEILRSSEGILLNQRKYALELIEETELEGAKPVFTPME